MGEVITAAQLNGLPVRIADSTLSGDAASISFSSIPAIYAHLYLECYLRADNAATTQNTYFRFNADSGANYDYQNILGSAATASATEAFGQTLMFITGIPGNNAGANLFAGVTIDVPHYAQTANNKDIIVQSAGKIGTSTGNLGVSATVGFWRSNAAVSTITIGPATGNLKSGSRATLFGMP